MKVLARRTYKQHNTHSPSIDGNEYYDSVYADGEKFKVVRNEGYINNPRRTIFGQRDTKIFDPEKTFGNFDLLRVKMPKHIQREYIWAESHSSEPYISVSSTEISIYHKEIASCEAEFLARGWKLEGTSYRYS